jgi:hypothetical protein
MSLAFVLWMSWVSFLGNLADGNSVMLGLEVVSEYF